MLDTVFFAVVPQSPSCAHVASCRVRVPGCGFASLVQSYRNTVPVPRHWCQKRKYLQGKRGIEKTPFELPEFIAMTGIDKIRAAIEEADSLKKV